MAQGINALRAARPECKRLADTLALWNLRRRNADLPLLRPELEEHLARHQFGLIIVDLAYKLLGDRDENANGEIASLMNEFKALARSSGAAILVAHHFAKGESTSKSVIDRMSGAGAWSRAPDPILVLTQHEEPDCFTVSTVLPNLPQVGEFVVGWEYSLMRLACDLNPDASRRPQAKNKVCSDREFMNQIVPETPTARSAIVSSAKELGISAATTDRYLKRLSEAGLIRCGSGLYCGH